MKREIISFDDEAKYLSAVGGNKEFKVIEEEKGYFDTEKATVEVTVVVKRLSDGKFFWGEYVQGHQGYDYANSLELEEVFEERETIITYK